MKTRLIRFMSLLLAMLMVFTAFVGCGQDVTQTVGGDGTGDLTSDLPTPSPTPNYSAYEKSDYIIASYIYNDYQDISLEDVAKLNIIFAAFGLINERDNKMYFHNEENFHYLTEARDIVKTTKIVLSIGGWGADGFSQMARTKEGREAFIQSVMDFVDKYKLDGVDMDWEYPVTGGEIVHHDSDKDNFTLLMKELREALDQRTAYDGGKMILSFAAAASNSYWRRSVDTVEVMKYVDYVNLMTYDFAGSWSGRTGHHTNLAANKKDGRYESSCGMQAVEAAMNAGVPANKIIYGAASYGKLFMGVTSKSNNGLGQEYIGGCTDIYLKEIEDLIGTGNYVRYWDSKAKAPYLFDGKNLISYDDAESIKAKVQYIVSKGLGGIMYWEYTGDTEASHIINVSYEYFLSK